MSNEMTMSVSPVCVKDEKRFAYVSFTDGERSAEGKIPDCKIVSSTGFEDDEIRMLEEYMEQELPRLKRMAASIRLMDAFMKE